MLINGGSKYNRKRRKHNNKKKKRGRKKKKKAPNQADSTTGSALNTNRQSKTNKWHPLKYEKSPKEVPLINFGDDEYKTSKICNKCRSESLEAASHARGQGVLECKTCSTLWQQDVNAVKNMLSIDVDVWMGKGRPEEFKRQH
ncbi:hypothetical protein G6F56_000559 [Rhizopus delemar]|nr:hypothetical protein G6F56_000559 [Rhizopus delemar]